MTRVMLDSNVYDQLLDNPAMHAAVRAATEDGRLQILTTHVQRDELDATRGRDPRRADGLLEIWSSLATPVVTSAAVWGVSRWDEATWSGGPALAQFETVMQTPASGTQDGLPGNTNDALIVETARTLGVVFVTMELKRAKNMAERVGVTVWSLNDLLAALQPADGARSDGASGAGGYRSSEAGTDTYDSARVADR